MLLRGRGGEQYAKHALGALQAQIEVQQVVAALVGETFHDDALEPLLSQFTACDRQYFRNEGAEVLGLIVRQPVAAGFKAGAIAKVDYFTVLVDGYSGVLPGRLQ